MRHGLEKNDVIPANTPLKIEARLQERSLKSSALPQSLAAKKETNSLNILQDLEIRQTMSGFIEEIAGRINIEPVAKGRPRLSKGHTYTPQETRDFERALQVVWFANKLPKMPKLPLFLLATFFIKPPKKLKRIEPMVRPDLDNYLKAFMDALNGLAWDDDGQICCFRAGKIYSSEPGISFRIYEHKWDRNKL